MSKAPSSLLFFGELKRRNVYKVGAMYAIGGWLLVQVVTQIGPLFDLSAAVMRWLVIALVAGFPVALIVSWIYDLTPQGLVRTDDAGPDEATARYTGQQLNRVIIGVLVVAVLVMAAKLLWPRAETETAAAEHGESTPAATPTADNAPNTKSIAVLPFANRSEDKSNAYFAEGIQDEILTRLAKISALKVSSRISTAHYASAPDDLPAIARQLGVANILEGSVQKSGDSVRINVQLINAVNDKNLWAETYDRKLTDIFGVESEVAKAIADALQAQLSGSEQQELALKSTDNAEAFDAYLRGLTTEGRNFSTLAAAVRFYEQATQLDPHFARAWARLSRADAVLVFRFLDTSPARRAASKQALDMATKLQPDATDTLLAQAYYRYGIERNYPEAKRMFEALRARLPSSSDIPFALSAIVRRQGLWDSSLAYSDQAIALDSGDPLLLLDRAFTYAILRRYAEAIKTLDRNLILAPGEPDSVAVQAYLYMAQGQLDQARQVLARLPSNQATIPIANATITLSLLEHDYPRAVELLTAALGKPELSATANTQLNRVLLGFAQRQAGDIAAAKTTNLRARRELEALRESQPDNAQYAAQLALVYAALGEKDRALKEGERAVALLPASRDAVLGPVIEERLAAVEAQVGESGRAIGRLQHLLSIGYTGQIGSLGNVGGPITVALLRLDPIWDPLRKDPRFQKLIVENETAKPVPTPSAGLGAHLHRMEISTKVSLN